MARKRPFVNRILAPRPARRGWGSGGSGGNPKVVITTPPAASYQNLISGPGAVVRLTTAVGNPILLAGVVVSVTAGGGVGLTATPATATTDANGIATFTALLFNGAVGTYTLTFSAPGYVSAQVTGIQVTGAVPVASTSTANVTSGRVGTTSIIPVTLRDVNGNPILIDPGGISLTLLVTGANSISATAAPINAQGTWDFSYIPSNAGTETLTIKLNGVSIGGSPYTRTIQGISTGGFDPTHSFRYGISNLTIPSLIGSGPYTSGGLWPVGGDGTPGAALWRMTANSIVATDISAAIDAADQYDVVLVHTIAGQPGSYGSIDQGGIGYDEAAWRANVDRFLSTADGGQLTAAVAAKYQDALARRRIIIWLVDEPSLGFKWDGTLWPWYVARMAAYVKDAAHWPGCLTFAWLVDDFSGWSIRSNPVDGRSAINNIQPDGVNSTNLPNNYYAKLDFVVVGGTQDPNITQFTARKAGYDRAKQHGYKVIFGEHWINGGIKTQCFPYTDPNGVYSGPSVHIHGGSSGSGQSYEAAPCNEVSTDKRWIESPQGINANVQAMVDPAFADVPGVLNWIHGAAPQMPTAVENHMRTSTYVNAFTSAIRTAEGRSTPFTWPPAK